MDAVELAHALQVTLHAMDALSAGECAYHPTEHCGSYASQVEAAAPTIAAFLADRLPVYVSVMERQLAANGDGQGVLIGESLSFADIAVFSFLRGWRSSAAVHWNEFNDAPLLKAFAARMAAEPRVRAFLDSEACTKMEDPRNTPLAEPPLVQVNSFM
eukprot:TRINITY_DN2237_c0_g1_i3.p2 TRINITY_DN2237_c0_g1~~TRINITY_DN2237_c0_g1_i3.p2  ORF type:complete len:158 (+),score=41.85 TRINITY_DN2237_c0_g1_i3:497-970(+)